MIRKLAIIAVALLAGCGWADKEEILSVVWSDDGAEQAYVVGTWQIESTVFGVPEGASTRNRKHRLFVRDADGSNVRDVYGEKPEHGFGRLHHMRSAGYLVAGYQDGNGIRYERVRTDGTADVIATNPGGIGPCGTFEVIPSPDGATFAVITRVDAPPSTGGPPPSAVPACFPGTVQVELRNASSLSRTAGPFSWNVDGLVEATWTPADELIVASGTDAWRIDASGPTPTSMPGCLAPQTTSSNVSASGVKIEPGTPTNPVRETSTNAPTFGCQ